MSKLNYKTIFNSLIIIFSGYILEYYLNSYVASHITPALFGDFSLAFRLMILAGPLYLLGMPSSVIKYISKFHSFGDNNSILQFLKWSISTCLKISIILIPFFSLIILFIFALDYYQLHLFADHHAAVYFQFLAPLISAALLLCSFFLAFQKILSANVLEQLLKNMLLIICVTLLFSVMDSKSIHAFHLALCIAAGLLVWVIIIVLIFINNKNIGSQFKRVLTEKIPETELSLTSKWSAYGKKILINSTIFTIIAFLDLLIIEVVPHYGEHNVGYYAACLTVSSLVHVTRRGTFKVLMPFFSAAKDSKSMQLIVNKAFRFQTGIILSQCVILIVFAKLLLSYFGPSYAQASNVLRVLIIGYGISILPSLSVLYLLFKGFEKTLLKANYFIFISTLVFGPFAYYFYGLIGIATAISLILILNSYTLFFIVKRKTDVKFMILF